MGNKRSIWIIAIILFVSGAIGCYQFFFPKPIWKIDLFVTIFSVVAVLCAFCSALGLLWLKEWSRKLSLLYAIVIFLIPNLFVISEMVSRLGWVKTIPPISMALVALSIVWFLTRPTVRSQFK